MWKRKVDACGDTPLHCAFVRKCMGVFEALTAHGADVMIRDRRGLNAIDVARQTIWHADIAKMLLAASPFATWEEYGIIQ